MKKTSLFFVMVFISAHIFAQLSAQSSMQEIPYVYSVEHSGASYAPPVLPAVDELPVIEQLPDPFAWSDGSGRSTSFDDWAHHRAEIKAQIEHYEIGPKPTNIEEITASYADGVLTVNITNNGETLTITPTVILPEGEGPFPAVIGMDGISVSRDIFTSRNIAIITFTSSQVMSHTQSRGNEPINKLYPELTNMGAYAAWPWGVSRLIDGLELTQDILPIDLKHLAVTGCSYAGKMALWSGALDERVALTIAQEPGGGGAAAWRVSETLGEVEKLGATNSAWFEQRFKNDFSGSKVTKLPFDNHELVAMCVPRACLILGNSSQTWLAEEAGYVSCRATQDVYNTLGIKNRFGFVIDTGHGHCAASIEQNDAAAAFVDKFLLGDETANTNIEINTFPNVEYLDWFEAWGRPGIPRAKTNGSQNVIDTDNDSSETITLDASDSYDKDGEIVSYIWTEGDVEIASGVTAEVDFTIGSHNVTLTITNETSATETADIVIKINPPQGPYEGTAHAIPGIIEAEHYDIGGNGAAYFDDGTGNQTGVDYRTDEDVDVEECSDTNGGHSIGWWTAGEWLEYTINVAETDTFDIVLRAANSSGTKKVDIQIDDDIVADDFSVPATGGWQAWQDIKKQGVILEAGEHVMRITMGNANYINLNYIEFVINVDGIPIPEAVNTIKNQDIMLYPNKVKEQFTVEIPAQMGQAQALIFQANGALVKTVQLNQQLNTIQARGLPSGLYIMKIKSEDVTVTRKFMKE